MRPRTPPLGPRESSDFASGEFALPFVPVPPTPTSNVRQEDLRLRVHLPGSRAEDLDRSQSLGDGFFSPSNSFRALPGVERSRLKFGLVMLLLLFLSGFTILNMFLNEITANDAQVYDALKGPEDIPLDDETNITTMVEQAFERGQWGNAADDAAEGARPRGGDDNIVEADQDQDDPVKPAAGMPGAVERKRGRHGAAAEEDRPAEEEHESQEPAKDADSEGERRDTDDQPPPMRTEHAFASVISNEKYVDGAIVLALSLFDKSPLLQTHKCELVLLGPKDLRPESAARLKAAGYSQIKSLSDTLAGMIPDSAWKDTFDKLYLWSFTEYKLLAYFDADMLAFEDPDSVFDYHVPNSSWIAAHGSRNKQYFQTGMMVIRPDQVVFNALLDHFKEGVRTEKFSGANARDGQVARSFFGTRFVRISPAYSMYKNATEGIRGIKVFHFRGKFKPWYNMNDPPVFKPSHANGAVEFGAAYRIWWEYFEAFHRQRVAARLEPQEGYGGANGSPVVHPWTHFWMLRYTKEEYVQPLWSVTLQKRNVTYENMKVLVGHRSESCDTVCEQKSLQCHGEGLALTPVNSCPLIARAVKNKCQKCVIDESDHYTPAYDPKSGQCYINYLHDKHLMPNCKARSRTLKRVCVCVPEGGGGNAVPFESLSQISFRA